MPKYYMEWGDPLTWDERWGRPENSETIEAENMVAALEEFKKRHPDIGEPDMCDKEDEDEDEDEEDEGLI